MKIKLKQPTYEVVLPTTGKKVRCKPLTFDLMRYLEQTDAFTLTNVLDITYRLLFERIENAKDYWKDYREFIATENDTDLEAVAYGVICATYKEPTDITLTCPYCNTPYPIKVDFANLITGLRVNEKGEPIPLVELDVIKDYGIKLYLTHYPRILKILQTFNYLEKIEGLRSTTLEDYAKVLIKYPYIASVLHIEKIEDEEGNSVVYDFNKTTTLKEIIEVSRNLDVNLHSKIADAVANLPYYIEAKLKFVCTNRNCSHFNKPIETRYSFLQDFFLQVASALSNNI